MDLLNIIAPIGAIAGLSPATTAALLPIVILGSQAIGKLIPDKKKGFWGFTRKAFKVIGLYVKNNETEKFGLLDNPDKDGFR
jgi:hypothetical protein